MALVKWVDPDNAEKKKGSRLPIAAKDNALVDDKLEVKFNGEWYSAELHPSKDGITGVQLEGCNEDPNDDKGLHLDWDADKIKSLHPLRDHIRVRSHALHHDACKLVRVSNLVMAAEYPKENRAYHSAFVHKMRTCVHRHGPAGEICECTFTVEWLGGPRKGRKSTLRCESIAKLHSTKDVGTHPLIVDIVNRAFAHDVVSLRGSECNDSDEDEWVPEIAQRQVSRNKHKPKPVKVARLKTLARAKMAHNFACIPRDTHITGQNTRSGPTRRKMRGQLPFAEGMALFSNCRSNKA